MMDLEGALESPDLSLSFLWPFPTISAFDREKIDNTGFVPPMELSPWEVSTENLTRPCSIHTLPGP
jgi:hypothetical protein